MRVWQQNYTTDPPGVLRNPLMPQVQVKLFCTDHICTQYFLAHGDCIQRLLSADM